MSALIRQMHADELPIVLDWAAQEGWNPGLDDAQAFYATDPAGFFVAEDAGNPVAAISVVNHDATQAFLGLYLCLPAWRGRGIGFALWSHALAHAENRCIGLDGVAAQQSNYARSGFHRTGATTRWSGTIAPQSHDTIRPYQPTDFNAICALDHAANGYDRRRFLREWLAPAPHRTTFVATTVEGLITGVVTLRACRQGAKIGPLIAPDAATALALCQAGAPLGPLALDLPSGTDDFAHMLVRAGFEPTFAAARMYRGTPPRPTAPSTLWAIATMELG